MTWTPGALAPRPGQAPLARMLAAQTGAELKLTLRNGEQLLLNLVLPLGLLVVVTLLPFVSVDGADTRAERAGFFVPGVLALAVMSSAFTGQAIATGFERQYGVLKRLGATPLPRSVLLLANHGSLVCAPDLSSAVDISEELEAAAELALALRGLPARLLDPDRAWG